MSHEIGRRILRPATPEEKERHERIRQEIEAELPELQSWAKAASANHRDRVTVGTVFTSDEVAVLQAIDDYAAKHSLKSRGAVVRDALARLLGIKVARP